MPDFQIPAKHLRDSLNFAFAPYLDRTRAIEIRAGRWSGTTEYEGRLVRQPDGRLLLIAKGRQRYGHHLDQDTLEVRIGAKVIWQRERVETLTRAAHQDWARQQIGRTVEFGWHAWRLAAYDPAGEEFSLTRLGDCPGGHPGGGGCSAERRINAQRDWTPEDDPAPVLARVAARRTQDDAEATVRRARQAADQAARAAARATYLATMATLPSGNRSEHPGAELRRRLVVGTRLETIAHPIGWSLGVARQITRVGSSVFELDGSRVDIPRANAIRWLDADTVALGLWKEHGDPDEVVLRFLAPPEPPGRPSAPPVSAPGRELTLEIRLTDGAGDSLSDPWQGTCPTRSVTLIQDLDGRWVSDAIVAVEYARGGRSYARALAFELGPDPARLGTPLAAGPLKLVTPRFRDQTAHLLGWAERPQLRYFRGIKLSGDPRYFDPDLVAAATSARDRARRR